VSGSTNCNQRRGISILGATRPQMLFYKFDASYCQRLRDGDAETGKHFVLYFGPLLLAKLRRRVRSMPLIEEIRQETFLRTFRALRSDGLRQPEQLGAFVHGICDNTMRELLRWDSRTQPLADDADHRPGDFPTPEADCVTAERKRMVRAVLEQLPARDQKILRAVFLEERDKEDVCRELDVDRSHLRVLLHRAKAHFRAIFVAKDAPAI
jgi:RNA polymerase sigma-70 factor (ECF subfamily)